MPLLQHDDSSSTSSTSDDLTREDSEGWQDAEPEQDESLQVKDLFSDEVFPNITSMLENCKSTHSFDLKALIHELGLDFEGAIRLVNYLRYEMKFHGRKATDITSRELFQDDMYLKPVLEDDALLFSLDDILDPEPPEDAEQKLADLTTQFEEYRLLVAETERKRLVDTAGPASAEFEDKSAVTDKQYFDSYDRHSIHMEMLQDTARTDAYRDFIYGNKHLFAGKVVLDIGCGTGILSMFCAKAGAAKVIAVDNSSIVEKARAIIAANKLDNQITVIRGKIEEIALPLGLDKVDIIVSEWMGYCLLYEAMLDSVIHARDRFLRPETGLMVPSHCTLHMAAIEDPTYIADNYTFWQDVYGFDMSAMMTPTATKSPYDEVDIRHPDGQTIVARNRDKAPFQVLDLHTIKVGELDLKQDFSLVLDRDVDEVDAFVLWFDALFMPTRATPVPAAMLQGPDEAADALSTKDGQAVILPTGPQAKDTHWHCGLCVLDRNYAKVTETGRTALVKGDVINGRIEMKKDKETNKRGLTIGIKWATERESKTDAKHRRQKWYLV